MVARHGARGPAFGVAPGFDSAQLRRGAKIDRHFRHLRALAEGLAQHWLFSEGGSCTFAGIIRNLESGVLDYTKGNPMKCMLELTVSAVVVLAVAAGCGGTSSDAGGAAAGSGTGGAGSTAHAGASSTAGGASSTSGGASSTTGGASATAGGAPASTGPFTTSVPASTPLGSLTPDQLTQICSDVKKYVDSTLGAAATNYECQTFAVIAAVTATSDAAAEAACKASLSTCTPVQNGTATCDASPSTCTATVGEATTCFNDLNTSLQAAAAALPSCNGLTVAKANAALTALSSDGGSPLSDPPSCTKLDAECPGSNMVPPMGG
jgi:hypothetical protein